MRLPCKAYSEGSFCVVSLPPAALAALAVSTTKEALAYGNSTSSTPLPGSLESERPGSSGKARKGRKEETETGFAEGQAIRRRHLPSPIHAGHRRLSSGSLSLGSKTLLKPRMRLPNRRGLSKTVLGSPPTTGSARQAGAFSVSVATLCGCNSRLNGPRCEAPVLLGKLMIKTTQDVKGSIMRNIEDTKAGESELLEDSVSPASISVAPFEDAPATPSEESTAPDVLSPYGSSSPEEVDVPLNATTPGGIDPVTPASVDDSSKWRLLQYITGPAANSQATLEAKKNDGRLATECKVNTDCFSGMGVCDKGRCVGFVPDKQDSRLFRYFYTRISQGMHRR